LQEKSPDSVMLLLESYGARPDMVSILLGVLGTIPEEVTNPRLHIEGNVRAAFKA